MLGERLELAIRLAEKTDRFADIGADHGFLSAELLKRDPQARGVVTDISEKALSKAKSLIQSLGYGNRVAFVTADGLEPLGKHPVQTVFILGMGGETIANILHRGDTFLQGAELIIGGHTELPLLRASVYQIAYHIEKEAIAREKDRFYFLLRCLPGQRGCPDEKELYLGKYLMDTKPEVWFPYLKKQEKYLREGIMALENAEHIRQEDRRDRFSLQLSWVRQMLDQYEQQKSKEGVFHDHSTGAGLAEWNRTL